MSLTVFSHVTHCLLPRHPLSSPTSLTVFSHVVRHIPEIGCVITSGADLALCWWDAATPSSPSWRLRQRASLQYSQLSLCWCSSQGLFFSGGADGSVHAWDVCSLEVIHRLLGHEDAVTTMTVMQQRKELLVTGSLDRCIRLWDVTLKPPRCCHTLGPPKIGLAPFGHAVRPTVIADSDGVSRCHERGVTCLAFSSAHRHLFSGGLDHELLVWNALSERVICNLRQHAAPLSALGVVDGTPAVVSADVSGVVCVWDCRSLSCAQKLVVPVTPGVELTSMALLPHHQQIVTTARRLACFQGPKEPDADLTDSVPIVCGLYNRQAQSFCTASGSAVMIWDATSGQLTRRYADVTPTPITALCFDDRERKVIVADHAGHIVVLNYQNGAVMKAMQPHAAEVSSLLYIADRRYLITTSWDKTVTLQDESPPDEGKLIKSMPSGHSCDVTTAALSTAHDILATGGDDGGLQVWRLDERGVPHPLHKLPREVDAIGPPKLRGHSGW